MLSCYTSRASRILCNTHGNTGFLLVEVIGGYIANSLAIYSDAAHLLTDIAGFAISLVAVIFAKRPGCKDYTYGLLRAEIFGALASILSLWVITGILVFEAYYRALSWTQGKAEYVNGKLMFFVALFGVGVNLCLGLVFSSEHGGAFHPAHSHAEHGHGHDHSSEKHHDVEAQSGHDHAHGHNDNKSANCTSDHGHSDVSHEKPSESSSLVKGAQKAGYSKIAEHDDHDGHSHGRANKVAHNGHDHASGNHHDDCHDDHHEDHHDDHHDDHNSGPEKMDANIQAAYLHVITDLIQSVGVAIAGLVIWIKPEWQIIDPLCTFCFSLLVLNYTLPLLRTIAHVLLEGKPPHIDWHELEAKLNAVEGVQDVHDLHVWSISSSTCAMTVHIKAYNPQDALVACHKVAKDMNIQHATIQVQDAALTKNQKCLSYMCDSEKTCVVATPSNYLTGGF